MNDIEIATNEFISKALALNQANGVNVAGIVYYC